MPDELAAFDQAIAPDGNYAADLARRAIVRGVIASSTTKVGTREPLLQQALVAAQRALALAPGFGEAHLALGITLARSLDLPGAAPPGNAKLQGTFGQFAARMGHAEVVVRSAQRAVTLDPWRCLS